jgi:hypothetical protein
MDRSNFALCIVEFLPCSIAFLCPAVRGIESLIPSKAKPASKVNAAGRQCKLLVD